MADYVALPFICSSNDENYVNEGIKKRDFFMTLIDVNPLLTTHGFKECLFRHFVSNSWLWPLAGTESRHTHTQKKTHCNFMSLFSVIHIRLPTGARGRGRSKSKSKEF